MAVGVFLMLSEYEPTVMLVEQQAQAVLRAYQYDKPTSDEKQVANKRLVPGSFSASSSV
jgi:hypothetical protein